MTAAFKLKICIGVIAAAVLASFAASHGWHVNNPVPGLMEALHAASIAAGVQL